MNEAVDLPIKGGEVFVDGALRPLHLAIRGGRIVALTSDAPPARSS